MDKTSDQKKFVDLFDPEDPSLARAAKDKFAREEPGPATEQTADIDLHGLSRSEAEIKLAAFIHRCHGSGVTRARIITGVGKHSTDGPVLRKHAEKVLRQLKQQGLVASIRWEGREKTSGAILARLKR